MQRHANAIARLSRPVIRKVLRRYRNIGVGSLKVQSYKNTKVKKLYANFLGLELIFEAFMFFLVMKLSQC